MRKNYFFLLFFLLGVLASGTMCAQDFGFGPEEDSGESASGKTIMMNMGGEIAVELSPYVHDFNKKGNTQAISFWDMVSGKLNFSAAGGNIDVYTAFNLNAAAIAELWDASPRLSEPNYTPLIMDEAFLRGYIGPVSIEAGLRKLSWGKADSLGPLDVINPLDYTDLRNITDIRASKIARPLVHVSWNTGDFSKLETVFIPNFAGHRFAQEGRWAASQFTGMFSTAEEGIFSRAAEKYGSIVSNPLFADLFSGVKNNVSAYFEDHPVSFPDTGGLEYFQTGLRFTTTIGPADIGAQYFYGNLFRPDFTIAGVDAFFDDLVFGNFPPDLANLYPGNPLLLSPQLKYSRYHQLGVDYAQVLFDFNIRFEFAVHLTEDLKGDDGSVRNPFLAWSLGFDRDLFLGVNLNIQCNETIRLLNDKVGNNPVLDSEAGTDVTATRLTMRVSKKFFRDNLESKATVIWDIENSDCYIIPALVWSLGDFTSELSAGIFAGKESGELGQYWENSFIKLGLKYSF
jgi:hypothetical protein